MGLDFIGSHSTYDKSAAITANDVYDKFSDGYYI